MHSADLLTLVYMLLLIYMLSYESLHCIISCTNEIIMLLLHIRLKVS